jgi:hypothetical protein
MVRPLTLLHRSRLPEQGHVGRGVETETLHASRKGLALVPIGTREDNVVMEGACPPASDIQHHRDNDLQNPNRQVRSI